MVAAGLKRGKALRPAFAGGKGPLHPPPNAKEQIMAAKKIVKRTAKKNKPRVRLGTPKQYLWTLGVGLAVSLSIALLQGFNLGNPAYQNAQYLSDGCFVTSMLLLGAGALTWIGGSGFFDIFGYGVRSLPTLFTPFKGPKRYATYYDYKEAKAQRRSGPQYFLLISGAVFLLAAAICLGMYYNLPTV